MLSVWDYTNFSGTIAAFVSGGQDSMVMLDMLVKGGADLIVVHVNHHIRAEADRDSEFVRASAKRLGLPFYCYEFDIPALAFKSGRSIETEARLARREVLKSVLESGLATVGAFAHHADDNAETVLMHIFRGSGLDGLRGITESEKVLRPLLSFTREQIEAYARNNGITYVEDETNSDVRYTRNFIRHEVLPLVKTRYPAVIETLNRLAENAAETIHALDETMDRSLIKREGDIVYLSLEALSTPLKARYVACAAKQLMPVDITRAQIENVLSLLGSENGKVAELAGGLKAYREYDKITFCHREERARDCVPFSLGKVTVGGFTVSVEEVKPVWQRGQTIIGCVPEGAVFRFRREGDEFTPFGGHKKSLKKYLIDKKIPRRIRDSLVLLCRGSTVLAIVGVEISDSVKITDRTEAAYKLTAEEL